MFVSSILWSILCLSIVRSNHSLSFFVRPVELPPRCSLYSPFLFLTQFHSLILILPSFRVKQKYKVTLLISSLPSPFRPLPLPLPRPHPSHPTHHLIQFHLARPCPYRLHKHPLPYQWLVLPHLPQF